MAESSSRPAERPRSAEEQPSTSQGGKARLCVGCLTPGSSQLCPGESSWVWRVIMTCRTHANAGHRHAGTAVGSKGRRAHCKHMQLIFTMLSQPPPRQYNPPLGARTVCQENKRVSRRNEAGMRGMAAEEDTEERVRWKLRTREGAQGKDRTHHHSGSQTTWIVRETLIMRDLPASMPHCIPPAVTYMSGAQVCGPKLRTV